MDNNDLSNCSIRRQGIILLVLLIAIILPRTLDLDQYVTTDETLWLQRSANFYYALGQREFEQTYQEVHPGVSIMWAGALGFQVKYPEYRGMGQGYLSPLDFHDFLDKKGKEPIDLLVAGRAFLVLFTTITLIAAYLITVRLIGRISATIGFLIIAFDPFIIALNTILNPDNLLPSLMLLSSIAFMAYLAKERNIFFLVISAFAAGVALGTKFFGLFLLPYIGLLSLIDFIWGKIKFSELTKKVIKPVLLWSLIAGVVFFVSWPAMWVNPQGTISSITEAFSFGVKEVENVTFFNGQIMPKADLNYSYYLVLFLWRTTPIVAFGLILALIGFTAQWDILKNARHRKTIISLLLFTIFFIIALNIGIQKVDRYLIPTILNLDLVAAIGWIAALGKLKQWLKDKYNFNYTKAASNFIMFLVLISQILIVLQTHPYYWSYYNPLLGGSRKAPEVIDVGYGEGLDQAAAYLESNPNSDELNVFSWYGVGPFSYFYSGPFNYTAIVPDWTKTNAKRISEADYIVTYIYQWRLLYTKPLLDVLSEVEPEHLVVINNIEYAREYNVKDIPQVDFEYLTSFE